VWKLGPHGPLSGTWYRTAEVLSSRGRSSNVENKKVTSKDAKRLDLTASCSAVARKKVVKLGQYSVTHDSLRYINILTYLLTYLLGQ